MRSTEQPIEALVPDVSDLKWSDLMNDHPGALGMAVRRRRWPVQREAGEARERLAEQVSAFNNYI